MFNFWQIIPQTWLIDGDGGLFSYALFFVLLVIDIVSALLFALAVVTVVAFYVLYERRKLGALQRRKGPDVVGFWGILQTVGDGVKLLIKEFVEPRGVSWAFFVAPIWVFLVSLLAWAFIPTGKSDSIIFLENSLLFLLCISSLSTYGILCAGFSSGTRYSFLGGIRAVAQFISYEVALGMLLMPIILFSGGISFTRIVEFQVESGVWNMFSFSTLFGLFLVVMLAETNRTPFDLPEAEAELVAGFNLEYSSGGFALFFLAEYGSMYLMSLLAAVLFMGGWGPTGSMAILFVKASFFAMFIVVIRGLVPRYRYDQLMAAHWRKFLLVVFAGIVFGGCTLMAAGALPVPTDYIDAVALTEIQKFIK